MLDSESLSKHERERERKETEGTRSDPPTQGTPGIPVLYDAQWSKYITHMVHLPLLNEFPLWLRKRHVRKVTKATLSRSRSTPPRYQNVHYLHYHLWSKTKLSHAGLRLRHRTRPLTATTQIFSCNTSDTRSSRPIHQLLEQ